MCVSRPWSRVVVLALLLALALATVLHGGARPATSAAPAAAAAQPATAPVAARQEPGPIHAGNTWGWYCCNGLVYDETFVGPLAKRWKVRGPGQVRNQNGMLTLNTAGRGTVSAQLMRPGAAVGRWETRLRSRVYGTSGKRYRVLTELVPVTKSKERCGELNVGLNRYVPNERQLLIYARNRPDALFRAKLRNTFRNDQWHTFAVEITKKRISWFVDAKVVRTETRPEALSGVKFQVRFTMLGFKGKKMRKSRMQMDWLRHWNLNSPNKRSTKAPQMARTDYTLACGPGVKKR
jgi:hypothetical protein